MQINLSRENSPLLVYVMILSVTQLFSYTPFVGNYLWNLMYFVAFFVFTFLYIQHRQSVTSHPFSKSLNLLLLGLIMCIIPAYLDFNQSITDSLKAIFILGVGYMFYFYLHSTHLREDQISRCIIVLAIVYSFIEFLQVAGIIEPLFTVWSAKIEDGGAFHERFGVVRYQVRGICFLMFAIALIADKAFNNISNRMINLALLLIIAGGIYVYGARKLYYMTVAILVLSVFFSSKTERKYNIMLLAASLIYIVYSFYSDFSSESADLTEQQLSDSGDFIRFVSAEYFITSFSDSFLYPLFGSGIAWGNTPLHDALDRLADIGFYQADSGLIGYYSKTGMLGVISVLSIYYYLYKNWKFLDNRYKIYLISSILIIFFDFWAIIPEGVLCMSLCLYMCDKNIEENMSKIVFE